MIHNCVPLTKQSHQALRRAVAHDRHNAPPVGDEIDANIHPIVNTECMTPTTTGGRSHQGGRPITLADLIAALIALEDLEPLDRADRCSQLIEASKGALATERGRAYLDEMASTGETPKELAGRIGIHRSNVAHALQRARAAKSEQAGYG